MLYDGFYWFRRPLPPNVGELPETGLTLSPSIAPYGALTNKNLTAHDPILNWV